MMHGRNSSSEKKGIHADKHNLKIETEVGFGPHN